MYSYERLMNVHMNDYSIYYYMYESVMILIRERTCFMITYYLSIQVSAIPGLQQLEEIKMVCNNNCFCFRKRKCIFQHLRRECTSYV